MYAGNQRTSAHVRIVLSPLGVDKVTIEADHQKTDTHVTIRLMRTLQKRAHAVGRGEHSRSFCCGQDDEYEWDIALDVSALQAQHMRTV